MHVFLIEQLELDESPINSGVRQIVIIAHCQAYTTYESSWTCLILVAESLKYMDLSKYMVTYYTSRQMNVVKHYCICYIVK